MVDICRIGARGAFGAIVLSVCAWAQASPSGPPQEIEARYPGSRISAIEASAPLVADAEFYLIEGAAQPKIVARVPKKVDAPVAYALPGDVLATLRNGKTRADLANFIKLHHPGVVIVKQISKRNLFLLRSKAAINPWELQSTLTNESLFSSLEVNQVLSLDGNQHGLGIPPDQWSLDYWAGAQNYTDEDIDTDGAELLSRLKYWRGSTPKTVVVAVIDTGIARNHPALKRRQWINPREILGNGKDDDGNGKVDDINGWNFVENSKNIDDHNGHGTHIAGIIAAEQPVPGFMVGIAANARIMTLKVSEQREVTLSAAIEAIDYAVANGATIINLSWGSFTFSPALSAAILNAQAKEVFTVAAAGNALRGNPPVDIAVKPVYPCLMNVSLCVAATDQRGVVASYSNYSKSPGIVLLGAPGSQILSTISTTASGYGVLNGTSMAAPHVAAAAALLRGINPANDILSLRARLLIHSDVIAGAGPFDVRQRLNIYRSVMVPIDPVAPDGTSYCTTKIEREARYQRAPFANSLEPDIDGSTEARAFAICSARQLLAIKSQIGAGRKYFKIVRNLDWNELHDAERDRIGTVAAPFEGVLNGQGFALKNFKLDVRYDNTGLFARVGPNGAVVNFRMSNASVIGGNNVGALAGQNEGVINDVQIEGVIRGNENVGGIVGVTQHALGYPAYTGKLINVFFEGRVSGGGNVAGISGQLLNSGSIELAFAKGVALATMPNAVAGGIVGTAAFDATILQSHATVRTSGAVAGGAVGILRCRASISNSYTQMTAEGAVAGGLVGTIENAAIGSSYSLSYAMAGQFAGGEQTIGGLVGKNSDNQRGTPPNTFACTGTDQAASPSSITLSYYLDQQNFPGAGGQPKSLFELKQKATFQGWEFAPRIWVILPDESPALNILPRTRMSLY